MQESANASPGTDGAPATPVADGQAADAPVMSRLADLLREGETPSGDGAPSGDGSEGGEGTGDGVKKTKPKKFNDLAGALGIELDDLYKLEIASGRDGKPVTIESLKDLHSKQDEMTLRELQFEERRQQQESELIQAQAELREIVAALPEKAIKPEVLEKIRKKHDDTRTAERAKTLEAIPEWRDENRRTEDIRGMSEHLKGYGFPANFLDTAFSARMMKYVRDNWMREQRIRRALELVTPGKPNPTGATKPTGKAPKKPAAAAATQSRRGKRLETFLSGAK